jgi:hypothetical protein
LHRLLLLLAPLLLQVRCLLGTALLGAEAGLGPSRGRVLRHGQQCARDLLFRHHLRLLLLLRLLLRLPLRLLRLRLLLRLPQGCLVVQLGGEQQPAQL